MKSILRSEAWWLSTLTLISTNGDIAPATLSLSGCTSAAATCQPKTRACTLGLESLRTRQKQNRRHLTLATEFARCSLFSARPRRFVRPA